MILQMVGCSHHTAPIEVRERLAFTTAQLGEALSNLRSRFPDVEAVLLSTCNRVEVYTAAEDTQRALTHHDVADFLARFHGLRIDDVFDDLFERTGEDAVRHLFCVAASLDSMVLGETQILFQVKQAYELANQSGSTGPLTHAMFQAALKAAHRVAAETSINHRRTSVPSVAVIDFAKQIFEQFDDKRIVVIGAGEMADETLRHLRAEGAQNIAVVNRDPKRAARLADAWGGRAEPWERLTELLAAADLVVSTTGAGEPVVTLEMFEKIESSRNARPLAVLDLAVPRDFDPAIGDRPGVYLYGIDDLQETCLRNRKTREKEWPAAERIIEEETVLFMAELNHRAMAPTIRRLKKIYTELADQEIRRLFNKAPHLDTTSKNIIRQSFERLINKLLHPPLESLRDEAKHGTPHWLIDAVKRLFQLKD